MSSKKSKKKATKTVDLHTFLGQGSSSGGLPSGPGPALPSGPGAPGGRYGGRDRGRRGGYEQQSSRADESGNWRRGGPAPRRQNSSYGGDRGDRSFGRRDGGFGRDRGDRDGPRRDNRSRYGDDGFDRSKFGSGPRRTGGRSFGGYENRDRGDRGDRGDRRSAGPEPAAPTRDAFGTKKPIASVRSTYQQPRSSYNRGSRYSSHQEDYLSERGPFDGSGEGFGAELVADCFGERDSSYGRSNLISERPAPVSASRFSREAEPAPRSRQNPWGATKTVQPLNEKSPEELALEKEKQAEEDAKKRKAAEERKEKKRLEKEEKERVKREAEEKERLAQEEEARIKSLHKFIKTMFDDQTPRELTVEHLNEVFPSLEVTAEQGIILGQAMAMTVLKGTIDLVAGVQAIPNNEFDVVFINFLTCMCKRQGELKFIQALQEAQIDVLETVMDKQDLEMKLKAAGLDCLVPNNEVEEILENAFKTHLSLTQLHETLQSIQGGLPNEMFQRVALYIFDEFFTTHTANAPEEFFTSPAVFDFLCPEDDLLTEMLSACFSSWYNNGKQETLLHPVLDCLLKKQCTFPFVVADWNINAPYDDVKKAVFFIEDFWQGNDFMAWVDQIEILYEDEEGSEEEEEEEEPDYFGQQTTI